MRVAVRGTPDCGGAWPRIQGDISGRFLAGAHVVLGVDVDTGCYQEFDALCMAAASGVVEGGVATLSARGKMRRRVIQRRCGKRRRPGPAGQSGAFGKEKRSSHRPAQA